MAYYVIKRVFYRGGGTYVIVKAPQRNPLMLKGFKATTYYSNYTAINLNELVRRDCVDREFEQYMDRFLGEGEFRELITSYIRKCFKSDEVIAARLKKLEDYMSRPLKERRKREKNVEYPVATYYRSTLKAILRNTAAKYSFGEIRVCLFKRSFCVYQVSGFAVFLPYDVERISVDVVARLSGEVVDVLKTAASEIERFGATGLLGDALNAIKYTVTLSEMLG